MKTQATIFLAILSTFACFALLLEAQAVAPPPDGGYPGFNTAEGQNALFSLYTVRYDAVNAMLLNEFLKEHRKNEEQQALIMQLKSTDGEQEATIAKQQKQIEGLTVRLEKISAQLELSKSGSQTVLNNQ